MKVAILCLAAVALASCSQPAERRTYSHDRLARDVTAAMCSADAQKGAEAIAAVSGKSQGYPLDEVSDDVFDIASSIAKNGCPSL